eukprot:scaffold137814_cov27-Tisochrysis_lutea.AAC.1
MAVVALGKRGPAPVPSWSATAASLLARAACRADPSRRTAADLCRRCSFRRVPSPRACPTIAWWPTPLARDPVHASALAQKWPVVARRAGCLARRPASMARQPESIPPRRAYGLATAGRRHRTGRSKRVAHPPG